MRDCNSKRFIDAALTVAKPCRKSWKPYHPPFLPAFCIGDPSVRRAASPDDEDFLRRHERFCKHGVHEYFVAFNDKPVALRWHRLEGADYRLVAPPPMTTEFSEAKRCPTCGYHRRRCTIAIGGPCSVALSEGAHDVVISIDVSLHVPDCRWRSLQDSLPQFVELVEFLRDGEEFRHGGFQRTRDQNAAAGAVFQRVIRSGRRMRRRELADQSPAQMVVVRDDPAGEELEPFGSGQRSRSADDFVDRLLVEQFADDDRLRLSRCRRFGFTSSCEQICNSTS